MKAITAGRLAKIMPMAFGWCCAHDLRRDFPYGGHFSSSSAHQIDGRIYPKIMFGMIIDQSGRRPKWMNRLISYWRLASLGLGGGSPSKKIYPFIIIRYFIHTYNDLSV